MGGASLRLNLQSQMDSKIKKQEKIEDILKILKPIQADQLNSLFMSIITIEK